MSFIITSPYHPANQLQSIPWNLVPSVILFSPLMAGLAPLAMMAPEWLFLHPQGSPLLIRSSQRGEVYNELLWCVYCDHRRWRDQARHRSSYCFGSKLGRHEIGEEGPVQSGGGEGVLGFKADRGFTYAIKYVAIL